MVGEDNLFYQVLLRFKSIWLNKEKWFYDWVEHELFLRLTPMGGQVNAKRYLR